MLLNLMNKYMKMNIAAEVMYESKDS